MRYFSVCRSRKQIKKKKRRIQLFCFQPNERLHNRHSIKEREKTGVSRFLFSIVIIIIIITYISKVSTSRMMNCIGSLD